MYFINTLEDAKHEFKLTNDGDSWGTAMAWWFNIADELHFNREVEVPAHWQYRPSPVGPSNDPDDYLAEIAQGTSTEVLLEFGSLLCRYTELLDAQGKSY